MYLQYNIQEVLEARPIFKTPPIASLDLLDLTGLPTEGPVHNFGGGTGEGLDQRVLHVELDVVELLETQPLPVHRDPEIAQVDGVLGPGHLLFRGVRAALCHLHYFHGWFVGRARSGFTTRTARAHITRLLLENTSRHGD